MCIRDRNENLGTQALPPVQAALDKGMTREEYQNRAFRANARYAAIGKNPESYLQYISGMPTLWIVVSFEGAHAEEIESYWASKFGLKVLVVMGRWGKADNDPLQKGEGTFADCHKEIINPFILSNVFPEDVRAFVFEEDWCLTSKDAAIREMRNNPQWNRFLHLDPKHEFWDAIGRDTKPSEFLAKFQEYPEAHHPEELHKVVGESPRPLSSLTDTSQGTSTGEPWAADTSSASHGALGPAEGSKRRGDGGESAGHPMDPKADQKWADKGLADRAWKKQKGNDEDPARVPIYDANDEPLAKVPPPTASVHPDIVAMVSLAIQASQKKAGNLVQFSMVCGRGKDWCGLYGSSPMKYKFNNACSMFTKQAVRTLDVYLAKAENLTHFDYMLHLFLCTPLNDMSEDVLREYHWAMCPSTLGEASRPAQFAVVKDNLRRCCGLHGGKECAEKEPCLGDLLGACYLQPSFGHFCAHISGCSDGYTAEPLPPSWHPSHTGENALGDFHFMCFLPNKQKGHPYYIRSDWGAHPNGSGGQHESRVTWETANTTFRADLGLLWFTEVPRWIKTPEQLEGCIKDRDCAYRWNQGWSVIDCEQTPASVRDKKHADHRKYNSCLQAYWQFRNFTFRDDYMTKAHWAVCKEQLVPQPTSNSRKLWRGFQQPADKALATLFVRDDAAIKCALHMYITWRNELYLQQGKCFHKPTQGEYDTAHGIVREEEGKGKKKEPEKRSPGRAQTIMDAPPPPPPAGPAKKWKRSPGPETDEDCVPMEEDLSPTPALEDQPGNSSGNAGVWKFIEDLPGRQSGSSEEINRGTGSRPPPVFLGYGSAIPPWEHPRTSADWSSAGERRMRTPPDSPIWYKHRDREWHYGSARHTPHMHHAQVFICSNKSPSFFFLCV